MSRPVPQLRARLRDAAADVMLVAAEDVMRTKGYVGATMQDIAAEAGCAVGTLYLHFKNKEELLRGILLKYGKSLPQEIAAAIEGVTDPLERLRIFITSHLRWAHDNPTISELLCTALPLRYYDFKDSLSRIIPEEHNQMQSIELTSIREAQKTGQIRNDIPADVLTELVDGFLYTVMDQFSARPKAYPLQRQLDLAWGFISSGLQRSAPSAVTHYKPTARKKGHA